MDPKPSCDSERMETSDEEMSQQVNVSSPSTSTQSKIFIPRKFGGENHKRLMQLRAQKQEAERKKEENQLKRLKRMEDLQKKKEEADKKRDELRKKREATIRKREEAARQMEGAMRESEMQEEKEKAETSSQDKDNN